MCGLCSNRGRSQVPPNIMRDTPGMVVMAATVGTVVMAATVALVVMVATVAMVGMVEAHLRGCGANRHMRSMPPINLGRGQRLPPVIRPAIINRPPLARPAETALYRRKAKALKRVRASLATR